MAIKPREKYSENANFPPSSVKQSRSDRSRNLAKRIKYVTRCLANTLGFNDDVTRVARRLQELTDDIKSTGRKNRIQTI